MFKKIAPIVLATFACTFGFIHDAKPQENKTPGQRVVECSLLPTDQRLECYDAVAASIGHGPANEGEAVAEVGEPETSGKWRTFQSENPLDDSETVVISLEADKGNAGFNNDPIKFIARCKSNKTEVYIDWHAYLGDDSHDVYSDWKYVTTRIGSEKARKQRWSISTDNQATFAPGWAGDFLKRMLHADTMVVQTTPYGDNPVTAEFDIRGLNVALKPIAETCDWNLE